MAWIKNIALLIGSIFVTLVILEIGLRAFPVTDVSRTKPLALDSSPLEVSSQPNEILSYSREWNFKNARQRKTNNLGFFSDYDYKPGKEGVFVVGDSFVEAAQVDFDQTFHQLLANELDAEIYNFGVSGSPLSQYQAYVEDLCRRFKPSTVVIPIIANDFNQSMRSNARRAGFFHYDDTGALNPTPYVISNIRSAANASALARYAYFHLGIGNLIRSGLSDVGSAVSKESADKDFSIHKMAADYFLDHMSNTCLARDEILFVVDANRSESGIYKEGNRVPYMKYFIDSAERRGFRVVDLTPIMMKEFKKNGIRFEFPFDGHWDAAGHALVAKAVAAELSVTSR
ncbi:MAG: SGNH/GDSL hydrolase family protein [Stappiaceae bacterium]